MANFDLYQAFCAAAAQNDTYKLSSLLRRRDSYQVINRPNRNGETPLHKTASSGRIETVRLLVKNGADVNALDNINATPLHYASSNGRLEVAKFLVEAGANVDATDNNGWTPLHLASSKARLEVARLLVKAGANVHATNDEGKMPAQVALDEGCSWVADYLDGVFGYNSVDYESDNDDYQLYMYNDHQLPVTGLSPPPPIIEFKSDDDNTHDDYQASVTDLPPPVRIMTATESEIAELKLRLQISESSLTTKQRELDAQKASSERLLAEKLKLLEQKDAENAELRKQIQALESAPPSASTTCTTSRQLDGDTTSLTAAEVRLMQTNRELEARVAQLQAVVDQPNCIPYGVRGWGYPGWD